MAVGCVLLARWQVSRLDDRRSANAVVQANEAASPVAPLELATPGAPVSVDDVQWRQIVARGAYLTDQVLVRKRVVDGANGYYVLAALSTREGSTSSDADLWVVRGWIPAGADARTPSAIPPVPTGEVVVEGRARVWENPVDETGLPAGQVQRMNPESLSPFIESPSYPFWIQATSETPAPSVAPRRLDEPKLSEGPHLGYAIQWVFFSIGALVGGVVLVRRQREYYAEDVAASATASAGSPPKGP